MVSKGTIDDIVKLFKFSLITFPIILAVMGSYVYFSNNKKEYKPPKTIIGAILFTDFDKKEHLEIAKKDVLNNHNLIKKYLTGYTQDEDNLRRLNSVKIPDIDNTRFGINGLYSEGSITLGKISFDHIVNKLPLDINKATIPEEMYPYIDFLKKEFGHIDPKIEYFDYLLEENLHHFQRELCDLSDEEFYPKNEYDSGIEGIAKALKLKITYDKTRKTKYKKDADKHVLFYTTRWLIDQAVDNQSKIDLKKIKPHLFMNENGFERLEEVMNNFYVYYEQNNNVKLDYVKDDPNHVMKGLEILSKKPDNIINILSNPFKEDESVDDYLKRIE